MNVNLTRAELIAFEEDIRQCFLDRKISGPIHLSDPAQIDPLLEIFKNVRPGDWLACTYRQHWHALMKGVPPEEFKAAILAGRSMYFCDRERRIISSAIVGGMLPIAVGLALGLKMRGSPDKVWCFLGDMSSETGGFLEATKYAGRHQLPVTFCIEDNGLSTNSPTQVTWGEAPVHPIDPWRIGCDYGADVRYYRYTRSVPHVGAGSWVTFS